MPAPQATESSATINPAVTEFLIGGMTCANCARQVTEAIQNVPDVRSAQVSLGNKKATVRVVFVGDGINNAPALTQTDLGIAVSRASDIAREAADIILLKSEIEAVPEALGLARATLRTIKQNLFWAFFYNALGVPLAVMGFISPIFCAAAMGASDLIVIGNALRLLRWQKNNCTTERLVAEDICLRILLRCAQYVSGSMH